MTDSSFLRKEKTSDAIPTQSQRWPRFGPESHHANPGNAKSSAFRGASKASPVGLEPTGHARSLIARVKKSYKRSARFKGDAITIAKVSSPQGFAFRTEFCAE